MYSLCFEDPYINGGHLGLILVKIGQKKRKLLPYPKIAQYFCPKKRTGGGGWSKAVRSFSEISSIFVGRGLPSFNLGKFKPEIPIDPTPLRKIPFSVCLARSSQSCMICQSSVRATRSCLEQKLLCWFLRISDAQRTQTSCNPLWLRSCQFHNQRLTN